MLQRNHLVFLATRMFSSKLEFLRLVLAFNMQSDSYFSDVDECDLGVCSQDCNNTVGSFICGCYIGYELNADRVSCTRKMFEILFNHTSVFESNTWSA